MNTINYKALPDSEKLDLLKLLYHDTKNAPSSLHSVRHLELIVAETQVVYSRIKAGSH